MKRRCGNCKRNVKDTVFVRLIRYNMPGAKAGRAGAVPGKRMSVHVCLSCAKKAEISFGK